MLFSDLVGSTEISARLDPEVWHEIASEYQRTSAAAATRFGGHVSKFLGDGLVVLFGYPTAMEDAAERAVRAGLAIVEAMRDLNARFAGHGVKLQVRVGIHAGSVVVAQGGGKEADMFGDAPNIAARVQSAAEPDSVFVTDAALHLVPGLFDVEDRGAHHLKGIAQPLRLHRVAGASGRRVARQSTPFVGREDETELLARRWQRAREGEGQLVLMMGEPGIGKSRLVAEFRERISADAHNWIACSCEQLFNNTPFHAVTQMVEQVLSWAGGSEADQTPAARLERSLKLAGAKLDEALPLIAELAGISLSGDYPALRYAPELKRRRLFAALSSWVFGAAKLQPLVLVVEDLHWADPSTIELLQMLAEQGSTVPLLILCTARPEYRSPWPMRAHHAQLTLNRLSDGQTRELVEGLASRSSLLAEVIEGVISRTDGVPLFVEELAQLMLDGKGTQEIPATLQDSLSARLDRLGSAKDIAQHAAAIGREFSYELLAKIAPGNEGNLQLSLAKLTDAELILAQGVPPDATYRFKHALIRDAAYAALLKTRRAELHGRIAETIAQDFPDLARSQPQVLARHWTEAGRIEPAIAAWIDVAKAADARSAFKEAEEGYRQALALLAKLPETKERDAREIEILTPLIVVAGATRGWSTGRVEEAMARATTLAEKSGNLAQLVLQSFGLVMGAVSSGDKIRARAIADQLSELAQREGSDFSLRCALEGQLLSRDAVSDFAGAENSYVAWLALCERAGFGPFPQETTAAFGTGARTAWHLGRADTARARVARALAFGRQSSNPVDLVDALGQMTSLYQIEKNPERVEEAAVEGRAAAEACGIPAWVISFDARLSWARAHKGDARECTAIMQACIQAADQKKIGSVHDMIYRLAIIQSLAGEIEDALASVDRFLNDHPESSRNAHPSALQLRGELHRKRGEPDAAADDFRAAMRLAREIGTRPPELRAATSLARMMHERGETREARALLAPLYAAFTEGFDTTDLREAKALLDELG